MRAVALILGLWIGLAGCSGGSEQPLNTQPSGSVYQMMTHYHLLNIQEVYMQLDNPFEIQ